VAEELVHWRAGFSETKLAVSSRLELTLNTALSQFDDETALALAARAKPTADHLNGIRSHRKGETWF
jgi:hypothetical protein